MSFQRSLPVLSLPWIPPAVNIRHSRSATVTLISHTFIFTTNHQVEMKSTKVPLWGLRLSTYFCHCWVQFDVAGRSGIVRCACPRLCQIKGQRLDGEATLLFIPVQPRERPNKSGGNVVTRESERSLPTGWGKWRDSLIKSSRLRVFFLFFKFFFSIPKCHFHTRVSWPTRLRPPLIRSLIILCLPCWGF